MFIKSLTLKNIKSHQETGPIDFSEGVNAICGQTGAGKSTLLEAIGFAVFDSSLYKQVFFVREGTKNGEIVVRIVDITDEREYEIVRPIKRGTPYVYDPEIHRKLVEGKAEVYSWLKEHLKLEPSTELPALFADAVGVPQGLFTSAFLENLSSRKSKFDPLLQVGDYERVWENLRHSNAHLKNLLEQTNQDIARLEGKLEDLPNKKKKLSSIKRDIKKDQRHLKTNRDRYKFVKKEKTYLEKVKRDQDKANQTKEKIESNIANQQKRIESAGKLLIEAKKAQEIISENTEKHKKYITVEEALSELDERNTTYQELQKEIADNSKQLELQKQLLSTKKKDSNEYASAKNELENLVSFVQEQEKIERDLEDAKENKIEHGNVKKEITEEERKKRELESEIKEIRAGLGKLEDRKKELSQAKKLEKGITKETNKIHATIQSLEKNLGELETRQKLFSEGSGEDATCPVCKHEISEDEIGNLQHHYEIEIKTITSQQKALRVDLKRKNSSLDEAQKEIHNIEDEIEDLPNKSQLTNAEKRLDKLLENISKAKKREKDLSQSSQQVLDLQVDLKELGDPKAKKLHFSELVRKHEGIIDEVIEVKKEIKNHKKAQKNLYTRLGDYSGIEDEIKNQREILADSKASHNLYIQNEKTARTIAERKENKEKLSEELQTLTKDLEDAKSTFDVLSDIFDDKRFIQLEKEVSQVEQNIAKLDTRIAEKQNQLGEIEREIQELIQTQEEKKELEQVKDRYNQAQDILQFIREIIRKTGPYVKRALVHSISLEANSIFGDVISDHTMQLTWDEDYLIKIKNQSNVREFSQLSGGEKMSAAIAVRLALLKQMTSIRVAFFDEPTTHLDEERRENLASQIADIKGFNQLFVISHDDTFEKETHNVIRVSKECGVSLVETS